MTSSTASMTFDLLSVPSSPPSAGAPPGPPPQGPPFQSALDDQWARTAPAEGQNSSDSDRRTPDSRDSRDCGATADADAAAAAAASVVTATISTLATSTSSSIEATTGASTTTATATSTLPATASSTDDAGEPQAPSALDKGESQASQASLPDGADAPGAEVSSTPTASKVPPAIAAVTTPSSTATDTISPASAADAGTSATGQGPDTATTTATTSLVGDSGSSTPTAGERSVDPVTPGKASVKNLLAADTSSTADSPAHLIAQSGMGSQEVSDSEHAGPAPTRTTAPETTSEAATATPGATIASNAVSDASLTATATPGQPALAASAAQTPSLNYAPNLGQTIEAIHTTIALATRQGLAQARIALHPAELGEIRIHLSQSATGLVARVTADTQAAAQVLADGHNELRQSLSSLGLSSLHLDIGSSGEQSGAQGGPGAQARGDRSDQPHASTRRGTREENLESLDPATNPEPAGRPPTSADGALIDVLA